MPAPVRAPHTATPNTPAPTGPAPTFDIVRVSPDGSAVIAGRASPGADVTVFDGSRVVAQGKADWRGEFVMLPADALPAGGRQLTLASREGSGPVVHGSGTVVVVVPPKPRTTAAAVAEKSSGVVAVLLPQAAPARMLQQPKRPGALSLDVVDYDNAGDIRFTGTAKADAPIRFYVDNAPVGDARANAAGRWTLTPPGVVKAGVHTLRADEMDARGRVVSRVELPFKRDAAAMGSVEPGRVVVQPGQNLWRIARAAYGRGIRYTVIYLANREQIRNPRLIYPGQAFDVPSEAHGAATR